MSIRPRLGVEVPELTARVARASNPAGTTAMWVRDRLDGLRADEDFAGWYPRDGRPGISPAQLATVSVLQFLAPLGRPGNCDQEYAARPSGPLVVADQGWALGPADVRLGLRGPRRRWRQPAVCGRPVPSGRRECPLAD